jgi:hypothetical protein
MSLNFSPRILRRRFLALPAVLIAGLLPSCMGPVPVDAGFKAKRGQKVAVITMKAPQATVHHVGNQGLLDMAVNHATSTGSRNQLESYPSQAKLDAVGNDFAKRLNSKGYKATLLNVHPEFKDFNPTLARPNSKKPIHGYGSYLNGYDSAIYLTMSAVGRSKHVYGFIPLSRSNAIAPIQGSMFETATQKRTWRSRFLTIDPNSGVRVQDDSDAGLHRAIDTAVQNSSNALQADFFNGW